MEVVKLILIPFIMSIFPWKGIRKAKVRKGWLFFFFFWWIAAHDRILTLDNLMLRSCSLANHYCMCQCSGESVDHLLLQ